MATREELMEEVRLKRLREQVTAQRAAQAAPPEEPVDEGLDTQDVRGAGQAVLSGMFAGFEDEGIGALRALADAVTPAYDFGEGVSQERQGFGDAYRMYRDEARAVADEFREENPGTALALEVGGAIASPLARVAPSLGATGTIGQRVGGSAVRGGAEGFLYGLGQSEADTLLGQLQDASLGSATGFTTAAGLSSIGGRIGRALSNRRIDEPLEDAAGNFRPIHMADPEGGLGQIYRNVVGGAWGGRGALGRQESQYLNRLRGLSRFADEAGEVVPEAVGTRAGVRAVKSRIDDAASVAKDTARRNAQRLRDVGKAADIEDIATINRDALRMSVPDEYVEGITEVGEAGIKQVSEAIDSAYGRAWGRSTASPVTISTMRESLDAIRAELSKKERAALDRILREAEAGSLSQTLDRQLRELLTAKTSNPMSRAIRGLRSSLRSSLPIEGQDLLQQVDNVYPNYLASLRASTSAGANARGGMFNAKELAAGAKAAEGWRKAGLGGSDLFDYARPRMQQASRVKEQAQKGARLAENRGRRVGRAAEAAKNRVDEATKGLLPESSTAWSQAAATALIGAPFTLLGGPMALPAGAGVARGLASRGAQKAIAGQLPIQEAMERALREGDMNLYTQLLSRLMAQQATGE